MKQLTIWSRTVTERRRKGFFGEVEEFVVKYGEKFIIGSEAELNNPRLRIPFSLRSSSRSEKKYEALRSSCVTKKGTWKKDNRSISLRPLFEAVDKDTGRPFTKKKEEIYFCLAEEKAILHSLRSAEGRMRREGKKEEAYNYRKETIIPQEQRVYKLEEMLRELA